MKSTVVSKQIMLKTELHMLPNLMQCTCAVKAAQVNKLDNKGSELNYIKNGPTFQRSSPIVTMHICLLEAIRSSLGSLEWNMGSPKKRAEGGKDPRD
jgi:hypothetical protein